MNSYETNVVHALSFDIEDWFHIVEVKASEDPACWAGMPSIVERRTLQILEILRAYETRATFFVLGWICARYPSLVRMIADEGHEIATHSYWHRKVYELSRKQFYEDLKESIDVLEQETGKKVYGFRAPSFSIIPGTEWALAVIQELGLEYDASLFPARRMHGGYPSDVSPHRIGYQGAETLAELPMTVFRWGPLRFCCTGGGYFRFFPSWLIRTAVRAAERGGRSVVVYLHPRDFATDCPVLPMPIYRRFKCYVGRGTTEKKLRQLLGKHRFTTCHDLLHRLSLLDGNTSSKAAHTCHGNGCAADRGASGG